MLWRAGLLSEDRWRRLQLIDGDIIVHDLRGGIPFADGTVDVVYHSHLLEHIDRAEAPRFLHECYRVLKNTGILRIVVPDLEFLAAQYIASVQGMATAPSGQWEERHSQAIDELFEQMVRREPAGLRYQRRVARTAELLLRGSAAQAGELHRWMYDRFSLRELLRSVGFHAVVQQSHAASLIHDWKLFNLDTDEDGTVYKPGSLYMEAQK
jgi:SAM-dependent methyltransferase